MGMCCQLIALPDADIEKLVKQPAKLRSLRMVLHRGGELWPNRRKPLDLDKNWDRVHRFLTGTDRAGEPPLNFLRFGGKELASDVGVMTRAMRLDEVRELVQPLRDTVAARGAAFFDEDAALAELRQVAGRDAEKQFVTMAPFLRKNAEGMLSELAAYVEKAAAEGCGMVIDFG